MRRRTRGRPSVSAGTGEDVQIGKPRSAIEAAILPSVLRTGQNEF